MPSYAGPPVASRPGEVTSTLRLLVYLVLAIVLIALDSRGGWLSQVRMQANLLIQPIWAVAGLPGRIGSQVRDNAATHAQLVEETRSLRNQLLVANARLTRLQTAALDNAQLRELLNVAERRGLDVQLAPILDIDLDPTRQRLLLNAGSRDGVLLGQAVIDAGGLMGQVIEVTPLHSTVLLLTDPDHAVPVSVARNGVRLIVYGRGDRLELRDIPLSAGVQVGDDIVTSGLGGRFPAGFPVGKVSKLHPDDTHAFLVGELTPAAKLDRGRDVLLLRAGKPLRVVPGIGNAGAGMGNGNGAAPMPSSTPTGQAVAPVPTQGAAPAKLSGIGNGKSVMVTGNSAVSIPAPRLTGQGAAPASSQGAVAANSRLPIPDSRPRNNQGAATAPPQSTAPAESQIPNSQSRPSPPETDQ
ncbi:rod shape-determining protein MreC [Xanthomonas fragariae]|uniref:Cell shape-determining protein MreC n=2 Tax=Xanthomonas fragariae TaxID=48664 RepID=A0A1Y6H0B3_9XANT|nr:rod shape-determining protein MreC [Xanthomonas fragariae]AOD13836.1 rod shape-determining protein MreC [Xanthomonas fragariae]AOD17227.1 rod shape-determining protein MreC [Xanthomonas fragariae]ENZ96137.1 rod shape-determining protein MreC [Xanthomonas fragariae LMG 25863]MBL9197570.1 rod shape-determining protein MreC [Xanthomonas fragariae]MBL9222722.1 rod shape-determining protein MreC [Xanthomonas fragariae]